VDQRFWDSNYGGHAYDAIARRKGQPVDTPATIAPLAPTRGVLSAGSGGRSGGKTPVSGHRASSASAMNHEQVLNLQAQVKEMSSHLEGLEKERISTLQRTPGLGIFMSAFAESCFSLDFFFYFNKKIFCWCCLA